MTGASILNGWTGLALGYAAVQGPMIAGLARGRAAVRDYLLSPVAAVPLTAVAAIGTALSSAWSSALGAGPVLQVALGTAICGAAGYGAGKMLALRGEPGRVHQRGSLIADGIAESPRVTHAGPAASLSLAGIALQPMDEVKHFKLIGTTGTGKSTAIASLLDRALARGDRAVIADPDGGYLRRFYRPSRGDVILNPFDSRSVKWDLFGEISTPYDVDQLARALIPDHEGQDRSWRAYARTFFSAVTRQLADAGVRDVGELYRVLVMAGTDELRGLVRGTPAQPFLEESNARMFDSVRSVTAAAIGSLDYVAQHQGQALSVRDWVRERGSGVMFIPYQAGQIAALRSTISAWMRLAIFETMNGPEDGSGASNRTWFVVDELDALGQIDGLKDALARIRKFGGRCVLGFQSLAQVSSTYGAGDAHTLIENCANTLILRCSASEGGGTARFASQLVGDREVIRATRSTSRRYGELLGSTTRTEHFAVEAALLPSEIEQLPDMAGYVKLASSPRWQRVDFSPALGRSPVQPAAPTPDARVAHSRPRSHDSWERE